MKSNRARRNDYRLSAEALTTMRSAECGLFVVFSLSAHLSSI